MVMQIATFTAVYHFFLRGVHNRKTRKKEMLDLIIQGEVQKITITIMVMMMGRKIVIKLRIILIFFFFQM